MYLSIPFVWNKFCLVQVLYRGEWAVDVLATLEFIQEFLVICHGSGRTWMVVFAIINKSTVFTEHSYSFDSFKVLKKIHAIEANVIYPTSRIKCAFCRNNFTVQFIIYIYVCSNTHWKGDKNDYRKGVWYYCNASK